MLHYRKIWVAALALGAVAFVTPARAAEVDKLTPADAQVVVVINVKQALDSPLARKKGIASMIKTGIESNRDAKKVLDGLGLDPMKDITSVALAAGNFADFQSGKPEKVLITIHGFFNANKITAAAKDHADKIKKIASGATTIYEIVGDKGNNGYATLLGNSTILASVSKDYLLKAAERKDVGASKDLIKASAKANPRNSVWLALVINDEMRKVAANSPQFKAIADKLESITAGIHVTDAIVVDININTTDADAAKALKVQVDALVPIFKALGSSDEKAAPIVEDVLNTLKVTANPTGLNISLKVSEEAIDKIIALTKKK